MDVKVLTSCYWPQISQNIFQLPREMEFSKDIFTKWYLTTYSSRILKWDYSIGDVFLLATYGNSLLNNNSNNKRTITAYEFNITVEQVFFSSLYLNNNIFTTLSI